MSERCNYHWMFERDVDGTPVCAECRAPVAELAQFAALGHDVFLRPVLHSARCDKEGIGGYLLLHFTDAGRGCGGFVPTCACSGREPWTATGHGAALTLSPSVRCGASIPDHKGGFHGFVRDGKWVSA